MEHAIKAVQVWQPPSDRPVAHDSFVQLRLAYYRHVQLVAAGGRNRLTRNRDAVDLIALARNVTDHHGPMLLSTVDSPHVFAPRRDP